SCSISIVRVMRRAREARARPASSDAGVLAGQLHRQALAPFLATAGQSLPTPLGFHARAKTVRLDAALVAGAVRGLTHLGSKLCDWFSAERKRIGDQEITQVGSRVVANSSHRA